MTSPASRIVARALGNVYLRQDAVVVKKADGSYIRGRFAEGAVTRTPVKLVTAPVQPRMRETLPEGLRSSQLLTFYLRELVRVAAEGRHTGDSIEFGGNTYNVVFVHPWGGYYEAIGVRV